MKRIDANECVAWVSQRGMSVSSAGELEYAASTAHIVPIPFPQRPSNVIPIARTLTTGFGGGYSGSLCWITDHGIWPSEHEAIAEAMVARLVGDADKRESLNDLPGILFGPEEYEAQTAMLVVSLTIGWDAYFISMGKDYFARISHDEFIDLVCLSEASRDSWLDVARSFSR